MCSIFYFYRNKKRFCKQNEYREQKFVNCFCETLPGVSITCPLHSLTGVFVSLQETVVMRRTAGRTNEMLQEIQEIDTPGSVCYQ